MICPNCNHDNPEGARQCEECGADFGKTVQFPRHRESTGIFSSLTSCITSCLSYVLIALLVGITVAAVALFNCIFNFPEAPKEGYPEQILTLWEKIDNLQKSKCEKSGFAGESEKTGTPEERPTEIFEETAEEESMCGQPRIRFEPSAGTISATFDIYLDGFSANDSIQACWYYPSGELINCAELQSDKNGYRKTTFWSEKSDPAGEYRMEAQGVCSEAEATWTIHPPRIE